MLISKAWKNYRSDKTIEGYSAKTLKAYHLQFDLLIRYFGDIKIEDIDTNDLKIYLTNKGEHLKPSSLGHRIRFIKSLFRWAHDEGVIAKNPAYKLKEPKTGKRIPKFLTDREVELLREACETPLENAIFEFMFSTGCRIGEIVGLNRFNIDISNQSAIVLGKGDKEREVYYNTRCDIWLKRYLQLRSDSDDALFVTERNPHRMTIAQMRYIIKRISKRAGIKKNVFPHRLRHSYATHLMNNGAPIEIIQSLLGHERSETTKLYAQLSGKLRRDLYSKYF